MLHPVTTQGNWHTRPFSFRRIMGKNIVRCFTSEIHYSPFCLLQALKIKHFNYTLIKQKFSLNENLDGVWVFARVRVPWLKKSGHVFVVPRKVINQTVMFLFLSSELMKARNCGRMDAVDRNGWWLPCFLYHSWSLQCLHSNRMSVLCVSEVCVCVCARWWLKVVD